MSRDDAISKFKANTYCARAWSHLYLALDSVILPCCMASDLSGGQNTTEGMGVKDLLNAPSLKRLRLDMLDGVQNESCRSCYDNEACGIKSLRQWSNEQYWEDRFKEETKNDGSLADFSIRTLDIRLANICNFKCRSCGPDFSTSWYEDHNRLEQRQYHAQFNATAGLKNFLPDLMDLLPKVKKIQFAGGEPLVIEEHYKILKKCIELNYNHLTISYHTNLSSLQFKQYDLFELWRNFKKVQVSVSVDDLYERGEYLRSGLVWDRLIENMHSLKQSLPNVILSVNVTVSIFNIYHLDEIYLFFQNSGLIEMIDFDLTLLFNPDIYCIQVLPRPFKEEIVKKLSQSFASIKDSGDAIEERRKEIDGILDFMLSEERLGLQQEFLEKTQKLDTLRGESFKKVYPQVYSAFCNLSVR